MSKRWGALPLDEPDPMKVLVGIASIPERVSSLELVLESLSLQADKIALSLNEYDRVPDFVSRFPNVEATLRPRNGGDAEKFAGVETWDGVVCTCDDDVLYPGDYVKRLIEGLGRYSYRSVVGFHGGTTAGYNGKPTAANEKQIRCLGDLDADDRNVNVLGTGAMAWHTDFVPIWRDLFRYPNMADVHFACHARLLGIPMVALEHKAGWLKDICPPGRSIYESNRDHDGSACDTRLLRKSELGRFDWTRRAPGRPLVRVAIGTCARPSLLMELMGDLERELGYVDLEVEIYEDKSDADYELQRRYAQEQGWEWYRFGQQLGKFGYWKLVKRQLRDARYSRADYFLFLPDDIRLLRHAIPRAIELWHRLDDPATLTLWRLAALDGRTNWTGRPPKQRPHATEIYHVDGNFLCQRPTLEALDYYLFDPAKKVRPSSGVGRQMSRRLHEKRLRMYRVDRSLAINNDGGVSIMNPDERARNPAVTL